MPVPLSVRLCGELAAASVRVMEPLAAPACVGVKVTKSGHMPLAGITLPAH